MEKYRASSIRPMGQCMSRKAAGAFAASAAVSQNRPTKMQKHQKIQSPDDENNKPRSPLIETDSNKQHHQQRLVQTTNVVATAPTTKGVAMSFGFRRRQTAPSIAANATAARRLANNAVETTNAISDSFDKNGNDSRDTDALTENAAPTGRSTPRLAPPKKEANATKISRFGFRHTQSSRLNKVGDVNSTGEVTNQNKNNNFVKKPIALTRTVLPTDNNNRNRMYKVEPPPSQIGRFTLQSNQLPRPEPIRLIETKTAKTVANNNKRVAGMYQHHPEETSSKDGSLTEDSGVGSHFSSYVGENDVVLRGLDHLDASPTFGVRRRRNSHHKPRTLEVVPTGTNRFDVRDLEDSNDSCDSASAPPLPQLPSAFHSTPECKKNSYHTSGMVRERTVEYQRYLERNSRVRKISKTSSEGFSDDYGEEEKTYRDLFRSEKTFVKPSGLQPSFLKSRTNKLKDDSSPPSSDEQEWAHGGEAMADDVSFSLSSSDESKDKNYEDPPVQQIPISTAVIGSALQSLMTSALSKSFTATASKEVKNVMLTIEDPKFAAVANNTGSLLDDETLLSPLDSVLSCSESEEIRRKLNRSSSNSKDINEKPTPPTPGTPTNASNSLSISDDNDNLNHSGKDDFLIDDEIADQPALIFEDCTNPVTNDNSSETMMESTPKPRRRISSGVESSPMSTRNKKFSYNRTGSLDTLSPCESIASDDLMMDFCYSQSSGLDDCELQNSGYPSLNDTLTQQHQDTTEIQKENRDWNSISESYTLHRGSEKHNKGTTTSRSRLLSSRVSTPNSIVDSPKSIARVTRPSATSSPVRYNRVANLSSTCGYDSDESIRLDRASRTAVKQDIVVIKTLLLKLRRALNETVEEELLRSETHNPFESQHLTNGIFNSLCADNDASASDDGGHNDSKQVMLELAELRRQVLFLQGQLEDREKTVQNLQQQMLRLAEDNYHANSAPASTTCESQTCNAATQTERIRPISAGPSLLNGSPVDGSAGSLVSVTESSSPPSPNARRSRPPTATLSTPVDLTPSKRSASRLWRQPGEPPSPQRYVPNSTSSIPRRAHSRTRTPASTT
ncbi:uncharacterized protein LOC130450059 isoform X2 [Diorhabda sublineata]|uniref:uncharacterized protein LOC130450059 isoform X2 n=1 Tax=Diorhabda sublineata TaxID=1163346 RepID=UPI0024E0D68C|nr:uncharacterized protein LOC130450059 isoform X2 [Diorhabda sublineata]